ncbi:MAG: preprotein translocase subunit YajC [Sphaerochaetaceae bacterium]|jgi:preprotein translocase subunit YajC|nr:preprotein translocase subunit YajC [Sphaerochaetaceae bacterium]MDD3365855.1 preprotein translocase subunit YajC [Sphaerochaetaceae bacterium]MDY0372311.1 preprotein translocase subunit YajC [Sphaerochaetaceae bacterium]
MNALMTTLMGGSGASGTSGSMTTTFITFGLIILIFYFLIIRPQKKRDKETKNMLAAMKKGDKIVSIGGIRGTIVIVKETTVVVKVDDNTRIEFSKSAIAQILDKKSESTTEKPSKPAQKESPVETVEAPTKKKKSAPVKKAKQPVEDAVVVEEAPVVSEDGPDKKETK